MRKFICALIVASAINAIGPSSSSRRFIFRGELDYSRIAQRIAEEHGIPPALFFAVIAQESNWFPLATSRSGARGLGQIMPATAWWACPDLFDYGDIASIYGPIRNLKCSARYLKAQLVACTNQWECALAAYNQGPGLTARSGGRPVTEQAKRYVPAVLKYEAIYREIL